MQRRLSRRRRGGELKKDLYNLLTKYDVAGPRYTSYPTVPAWTTDVGEREYIESLGGIHQTRAGQAPPLLSLYFHLPFCETLCHFCGCLTVITKDHARSREYVDLLQIELDRVAALIPPEAREVVQLHFGGGSPNFLKPEELKEIVTAVKVKFHLLPDAEVAIEMHPRTSTPEFCEMVGGLGFNRISLGVQDLDPKVQKLINRNQTFEMTEAMVTHLRKIGLNAFNFDLVYGLPGQSMRGWEKTLSQVLSLRPNRLAVYSYAHVPWLKPTQRSFQDSDLPPPEMKIRLFEKAYETLQNGYRLIGIDHFALADDELCRALEEGTIHRNFMGYSTRGGAHQIGFGLSAISYVNGNYFQNRKELPPYDASIRKETGLATFRGCLLTADDAIRRDLIMGLMCRGLVKIGEFEKQWQIRFRDYFREDLSGLEPFLSDRLLRFDDDEIRVLGDGFLFLRNIAMAFDHTLTSIREKATNPVFSRTV